MRLLPAVVGLGSVLAAATAYAQPAATTYPPPPPPAPAPAPAYPGPATATTATPVPATGAYYDPSYTAPPPAEQPRGWFATVGLGAMGYAGRNVTPYDNGDKGGGV